jgi:hypothetical protein
MFCQRLLLALALLAVAGPTVAAAPPPHGLPKILEVSISNLIDGHIDVTPGQRVSSQVLTSPNVGYVEARVQNFNAPMHHDGLGKFSLVYTVPWGLKLLPFLHHGWTLQVIARSIDGVEVKRDFPLTLR